MYGFPVTGHHHGRGSKVMVRNIVSVFTLTILVTLAGAGAASAAGSAETEGVSVSGRLFAGETMTPGDATGVSVPLAAKSISGKFGTDSLNMGSADSDSPDDGLTVHDSSVLLVWVASGLLLLGAALVLVLSMVRRQHANGDCPEFS